MMEPATHTIRVLLADDEPLARRGLEQLLAQHADCRIVAVCRNGREALRALREARADVAFLDVQMPGMDGFAALRALPAAAAPIIVFVTAYDEFAVRAFEERALDYLLKPVSQARFDDALERVRERLRAQHALQLAEDRRGLAAVPELAQLVVPSASGDIVLDIGEVDWIQAKDYCAAVHVCGRRHIIRESLASLEQRLDPRRFVRVHRSAIVQLDRVRELRRDGAGGAQLVLRDGTRLPVSRRRREHVRDLMRRR